MSSKRGLNNGRNRNGLFRFPKEMRPEAGQSSYPGKAAGASAPTDRYHPLQSWQAAPCTTRANRAIYGKFRIMRC